jgi:coenzyme F420-reducing hydrogenase delta subunit/NAD-dependent dihydropyrimidine dehydrogenase PreA subunit
MQYPPNVRLIRLPCSGKADITYILRAFETGVDGVIVAGCLKGGCHFVEGNLQAEKRVQFAKTLLDAIGIGGERLEMFFFSSSMATRFVEIVKEMTERIRKLGPSPAKKLRLTEKTPDTSKREFLYNMLKNLAQTIPEKPVPVPEGLEEFGRIECDIRKCIGCKKCGEVCPEEAIDFVREFDLPTILQTVKGNEEGKTTKRYLLYETLAKLAVKPPSKAILAPEGMDEFCKLQYNPRKCVVCEKCVKICPEKVISIVKEVDLPTILG